MEIKVGDVVHLNGIPQVTMVVNTVYEAFGRKMCSCYYFNANTAGFSTLEASPDALTKIS